MYLNNPMCNFEVIHGKVDYGKKVNMLCAVFFKMNKHYKDFNAYTDGLKVIINYVDRDDIDYNFRIFIDQNVYDDKDIMQVLTRSDNVTVVLYKCSKFMEKGGDKYHLNLFGTLIRFFPFFDFDNNDAGRVIVVDIDDFPDMIDMMEGMIHYEHEGVLGNGKLLEALVLKTVPYISASHLSSYEKYDKNILTDFIINNDDYEYAYEKNVYTNVNNKGKYVGNFGFGVDEIFLNFVWMKKAKMPISAIECYKTTSFIYAYAQHNRNKYLISIRTGSKLKFLLRFFEYVESKGFKKTTYHLLKSILGKYYRENMSMRKMVDIIDKEFYQKTTASEKAKYFGTKYYKTIEYLADNSKKWFDKAVIDYINTYLKNVFSATLITTFNQDGRVNNVVIRNKICL